MQIVRFILVLMLAFAIGGCGKPTVERSPVETLQMYQDAAKKKDTTQMKLLLSDATIKLHSDQAKAQNVTLDEIVSRETYFPPDQRVFAFRNVVIDGDRSTVDVKNDFGGWDQIILVKENGEWKIDKKGTAQQLIKQSNDDLQKLDDEIDAGRIDLDKLEKSDSPTPTITPTPTLQPASPLDNPTTVDGEPIDPTVDLPGSPLVTKPTPES